MLLLLACTGEVVDSTVETPDPEDTAVEAPEVGDLVTLKVTLDGDPAEGVLISQGGRTTRWTTDAEGVALVEVDRSFDQVILMASHPDARIGVFQVWDHLEAGEIGLESFDTSDNPEYVFDNPGSPTVNDNTSYCSHCHVTTNEDWYGSVHRQAASNPVVQGVYTTVTEVDGCADCHAPGIGGELAGHRLDEAEGVALESGVHCDVCHKVESVHLDKAPGVGGRLNIVRPSEATTNPGFGDWKPITFAPYPDVANPRMGAVQRDHFQTADFCAGCHELIQDTAEDSARWPDGLPIHTTFTEWETGPLNPGSPCQSCHMPPDADAGNLADIQLVQAAGEGIAAGWNRPAGSMRRHTWYGPRSPDVDMLGLAAALFVDSTRDGDTLTVSVRTRNAGPGHAIPTGEPLRSLLLRVDTDCGVATGGSAVPDFGGALEVRPSTEDWDAWDAEVGQVIRVVRVDGWVDYDGYGPFGDGTFSVEDKGLAAWTVVGEVSVTADGLAGPLPEGDLAILGSASAMAGAPGFGFARVTADADGNRMVPHHQAVDVVSDNRLLPAQEWTSTHTFDVSACTDDPVVSAVLTHRAFPLEVAEQTGQPPRDTEMTRW